MRYMEVRVVFWAQGDRRQLLRLIMLAPRTRSMGAPFNVRPLTFLTTDLERSGRSPQAESDGLGYGTGDEGGFFETNYRCK